MLSPIANRAALFYLTLLLGSCLSLPASAPLVIFNVIIDDLGHANIAYNSPNLPENSTPRLAALAKEGVILRRQVNHYTCTPSRSSFQSGRLPVHVQTTLDNPDVANAGMPVNMTSIAQRLTEAGYDGTISGKWDLGFARQEHTPSERGYNASLVYATHMNNYWSQRLEPTGTSCSDPNSIYDFWEDNGPAYSRAGKGVYIEDMFLEKALGAIAAYNASSGRGLFLDYRPHSLHWPLMVPESTFDSFSWVQDDEPHCLTRFYGDAVWPGGGTLPANYSCRRQHQAMLNLTDTKIGALVDALIAKNLFKDTLMTVMSDNGGSQGLTENAANNWPLRGGKYSPFEGGTRVVAFLSGGYLPPSVRGGEVHKIIHIADYFMTFCKLGGLSEEICRSDPLAEAGGLPPIDSIDFWPLILNPNAAAIRTEVPIDNGTLLTASESIPGPWWKLYIGDTIGGAGHTAPVFPNSSSTDPTAPTLLCKTGCMFDVWNDPFELDDVASKHADIVANLTARLAILRKSFFSNNDEGVDTCPAGTGDCACWAANHTWGGFFGPWQKS